MRAGTLYPASAEKASKGDTSVVAEGDTFLGNAVAIALWGDMGRRLLQRWIEIYAGECFSTRFVSFYKTLRLKWRRMGAIPLPPPEDDFGP